MTTTAHSVAVRNLRAEDQIELLSLPHVVTAVSTFQDGSAVIYSEHTDELGTIQAATPARVDEHVTVYITQ